MNDRRPYKKWQEDLPTFTPPWDFGGPPKEINVTKHHHNVHFIAGSGPVGAKVMFVMPALQEDDARTSIEIGNRLDKKEDEADGKNRLSFPVEPMYMKSVAGGSFRNLLNQVGLPANEQYITAICKWLLPKDRRSRPKVADYDFAAPSFANELERVKPRIIVCLGKSAFDFICGVKIKMTAVEGAWFKSLACADQSINVYCMLDINSLAVHPELIERFRVDLLEVKRTLDWTEGICPEKFPTAYETISDSTRLTAWVAEREQAGDKIFSVDCEWAGRHHVDGKLRSIQLCWKPGHAIYVRLMDDAMQYAFDVDYKAAGAILGRYLNRPDVKYIGHQLAADLVWMNHVLGLEIYRKAAWDTLYASQCIDENQPAGLERIAMAYTDLGRYDIDLELWKVAKDSTFDEEDGYGRVPDPIMIPYACRDVDTVIRAYPKQVAQMMEAGEIWEGGSSGTQPRQIHSGAKLIEYFTTLFLPFVTDMFSNFTLVGLPMDRERLELLRRVFKSVHVLLSKEFADAIVVESRNLLLSHLSTIDPVKSVETFLKIDREVKEGRSAAAFDAFKAFVPTERLMRSEPFYLHFLAAPSFNVRSTVDMRRWLFDVKGHVPIKSTNNKQKGLPSMDWTKVLAWPEDRRKGIQPSTDKQTIKVLSEFDSLCEQLVNVNSVGNLTRAFLRPAEVIPVDSKDGEDAGVTVKEHGLFEWIASDGRIHCNFSSTETARPRAWKPNCLNWPSYITEQISKSVIRLVDKEPGDSQLRRDFELLTSGIAPKKGATLSEPPSIRSTVSAKAVPDDDLGGWCIVESDYKTAEMRGLAYIANDPVLMALLEDDDTQFGALDEPVSDDKLQIVRLKYAGEPYDIHAQNQNPDFLMAIIKDGKVVRKVSESELKRKPDGSLWHPLHDIHWQLAESVTHRAREVLQKKLERDGIGKKGNFESSYGSTATSMERSIASVTGHRLKAGTGDEIIIAINKRQPTAKQYSDGCAAVPTRYYRKERRIRAASGRTRHFYGHDSGFAFIDDRAKKRVDSGLGREARNFELQESVASTSAKAGLWLTEYYRTRGMDARIIAILYDSVVTLCRVRERFAVAALHQLFMCDINTWHYKKLFRYPIDTEFNYRWSTRPSAAESKELDSPDWEVDKFLTDKVTAEVEQMRAAGQPSCIETPVRPG